MPCKIPVGFQKVIVGSKASGESSSVYYFLVWSKLVRERKVFLSLHLWFSISQTDRVLRCGIWWMGLSGDLRQRSWALVWRTLCVRLILLSLTMGRYHLKAAAFLSGAWCAAVANWPVDVVQGPMPRMDVVCMIIRNVRLLYFALEGALPTPQLYDYAVEGCIPILSSICLLTKSQK